MDIEQLSKSQVVLLTLLVTFVTSIATGIVTVSLMEQAPPTVAQTVNRVVERTVEKMVPSGQTASAVTQQKTVVIKESDLVAEAVAKFSPSVVRLYSSGQTESVFFGLGIVVDASGGIVSDTGALGETGDAVAVLPDGTRVRAFVTSRDEANGIAMLRAATSSIATESKETKAVSWTPAPVVASRAVLGESIVVLSGKGVPKIADGIVTSLSPRTGGGDLIDTSVNADTIMHGSPLIDTDGTLIGLSTSVSRASSPSGFISANALVSAPANKSN